MTDQLPQLVSQPAADTGSRCYTQLSRPHPPRADGEQDGAASDTTKAGTDPIRLVRMVKEMEQLREVRPHSRRISFTHVTSTWGSVFSGYRVSPFHLLHQRGRRRSEDDVYNTRDTGSVVR